MPTETDWTLHFLTKSEEHERITLGVVYAPEEVDTQGDFATAPEIEKACYRFNARLQGTDRITKAAVELLAELAALPDGEELHLALPGEEILKGALGLQHSCWDDDLGEILESYLAPCDLTIGDKLIKAGTWLMKVRWSVPVFAAILKGEITGYSMGGTAIKIQRS